LLTDKKDRRVGGEVPHGQGRVKLFGLHRSKYVYTSR